MNFTVRSSVSLVAGAALVLAACGGSDGGSGSAELNEADLALAAAVTADLAADDEEGFGEVFDIECMGREMVTALGGAAAAEEKYGFTAATASDMEDVPMEQSDAEKVIDGYSKCGDFGELLSSSFTAFGTSEADAKCVVDALPDGLLRDSLVGQLVDPTGVGGSPLDTALTDAAITCGVG